MTYANVEYTEIVARDRVELKGGAGCIMTDDMKAATVALNNNDGIEMGQAAWTASATKATATGSADAYPLLDHLEGEESGETDKVVINYNAPIKEPKNWGFDVPEGAKEFAVVVNKGLIQYPSLMLKNADGKYDSVAIYLSKKDAEPLIVINDGEFYPVVQTYLNEGDNKVLTTRHFTIVKIDPEGNEVIISTGQALDIDTPRRSFNWAPESLYQQSVDIGGHIPYAVPLGGGYPEMISRRSLPSWDVFQKWQAKVLLGLIEENGYEAVFTHNHACDHIGHPC